MDSYVFFIHSSADGHLGYFYSLAGMTHSCTSFYEDICYHLPDSILKSRDFILLTKVSIVKAMVFSSSHLWM